MHPLQLTAPTTILAASCSWRACWRSGLHRCDPVPAQQQPSWSAIPCSARLVTPVCCDMHYLCVPRCAAEPAGAGKCSPEAQGGRPAVRSQQPRWQRVGSNQGGARVVRRRQRGRRHVCCAAPMQPIQLQHPRPQGFPASHAAAGGRRAGEGWSCACSQHVAFRPIGRCWLVRTDGSWRRQQAAPLALLLLIVLPVVS